MPRFVVPCARLGVEALQARTMEQYLPCSTVIAVSVVTCDVAETADTHLPGRVGYAMGPGLSLGEFRA